MTKVPSDAEFGILTVLWKNGPGTVGEVHTALAKGTGYTSTLKQMQVIPVLNNFFHRVFHSPTH